MIHRIRENIGTIVICTVIIFGVPAAVSVANTNDAPTQVNTGGNPTQAVMIEIPVNSGGGGSISNGGGGGALGDD